MRLRYVGIVTTTFITGNVGTVKPGGEFTVPDNLASVFLARADVKNITEMHLGMVDPAQLDYRDEEPGQSIVVDDGDDDSEKMSEENDGVPNDH